MNKRWLVLIVAIAMALVFSGAGASTRIASASGELVTFESIIAAGAIAAMALCATIVAPERVNEAYADSVRRFVRTQGGYWMALFLVAVLTCVFVVLGQAFGWSAELKVQTGTLRGSVPFGVLFGFCVALGFLLTIILLVDFARAIRDLLMLGLKVTSSIAEPKQADRIRQLRP
jgi:hypothetical protein